MPGILKIGMTERTPEARLSEANASDTWRPPTPYNIEFAKKVSNASQKEKTLHTLLEQYTDRIHLRREFFRVSPEEVRKFFDLMDGEMWAETRKEEEDDEDESEEEQEEEEDASSESVSRVKAIRVKGCRDMTKCFTNGQRIRHKIGINKVLIGTYNSNTNRIVLDDTTELRGPCGLPNQHYKRENLPSGHKDGWGTCECEVERKWISIYSLPG